MYALTSNQGTAMADTALCDNHMLDPTAIPTAFRGLEGRRDDWDGGNFVDCTGNDALECCVCGATD